MSIVMFVLLLVDNIVVNMKLLHHRSSIIDPSVYYSSLSLFTEPLTPFVSPSAADLYLKGEREPLDQQHCILLLGYQAPPLMVKVSTVFWGNK